MNQKHRLFFFFFFPLGPCHAHTQNTGGTGMGSEIGNEGTRENCGGGSEGIRSEEEGAVVQARRGGLESDLRNIVYSYLSFDVCAV
jgi:hypothetical protein